jgi:hypothetical protein
MHRGSTQHLCTGKSTMIGYLKKFERVIVGALILMRALVVGYWIAKKTNRDVQNA